MKKCKLIIFILSCFCYLNLTKGGELKIIKESSIASVSDLFKAIDQEEKFFKDAAKIVSEYAVVTKEQIILLNHELYENIQKNYIKGVNEVIKRAMSFNVQNFVVNLCAKDSIIYTPLGLAAFNGNLEICKMLLDAGADVDGVNAQGDSSLLLAVILNKKEMVKILLDYGADVNQQDLKGKSPIDCTENDEMIDLLYSTGKVEDCRCS